MTNRERSHYLRLIPEHDGPGRLGRHVEHDERSRSYRASTAALRTVSHRHYGPVLDQGQLGSCTGNALVQNLMCAPLHVPKRKLTENDAIAAYERATALDDVPGSFPPDDTGSSGLAAAKAAVENGWIAGYTHAFGVDEALGALMLGPVMFGTDWHEGMDHPDGDGLIHATGAVRGGHEYAGVGYDAHLQHVRCLNSWGPSFGAGGFFWLSRHDLGELLAAQGDVTVLRR